MTKLVFYRQARKDGGLRTGIEINDESVMESFKEGSGPEDSALVWFVDIRCSVAGLAEEPGAARQWLSKNSLCICQALSSLAEELRAGMDFDRPIRRKVTGAPKGSRIEIACSSLRRLEGLRMASHLNAIAKNWNSLIASLPELATACP